MMVWSDCNEAMIHRGFTRTGRGFSFHYTWDEAD
jgi:hypothetical protein